MDEAEKSLGQIAYETYCVEMGHGYPDSEERCFDWQELKEFPAEVEAWEKAAGEVITQYILRQGNMPKLFEDKG